MESQTRSGRPESSSRQKQRAATYFNRNPGRLLCTTEGDLVILGSSKQSILRNRLHILPYKIQSVQQLKYRDYAARTWSVH